VAQSVTIREAREFDIQYSTLPDRSNPVDLEGANVAGDIYVILTPTTNVTSVVWYKTLGPVPVTDSSAPFDLVGASGGNALPLNITATYPAGPNTIHAMVTYSGGNVYHVTANFRVAAGVPALSVAVPVSIPTPTIDTSAGPITVTPATVHVTSHVAGVPLASGSGIEQFLGWSGGALSGDGWHDGTNVQDYADTTGTEAAPFVCVWQTRNLSGSLQMINDWSFYSTGGRKLTGKTPLFTLPLGFDYAGPGIAGVVNNVNSGNQDGQIDTWATQLQVHVAAGRITNPIIRLGHECSIDVWGGWSFEDGSSSSMTAFKTGFRRWALRIKAICPTARFDWNLYSCTFDMTQAYPGDDVTNYITIDLYDDWQGDGSAKTSSSDAYATYSNPAEAWNGLWKRDKTGNTTGTGSPAWIYNRAITGGFGSTPKLCGLPEWGLMARLAQPLAGGGDNPNFITEVFNLLETGNFAFATYFHEGAEHLGQDQDHRITGGNFPNSLPVFTAGAA
jgi:hypothetical protein